MYSFGALVFTGIICLIAGAAAGAALLNALRSHTYSREMERRVAEAENALKNYQHDVAQHFGETSALVNNLTQSYRDVHEHLAKGALKLATPAISRQILESAKGHLLSSETAAYAYSEDTSVEPPRDWAPRGEKGALSEDYGLDDTEAQPESESEAETEVTSETETGVDRDEEIARKN
ncbi:YhcB family protein [Marinimicrobium alkaliphilum]|uniref:YhcB family protein n=1 Tax=Marinimicrobium alkaliphilum TaxID=2202654 RepID=UPI000DB911DD|nr:DUF1043 family protein [Marinimicrobium alkaliphilum]